MGTEPGQLDFVVSHVPSCRLDTPPLLRTGLPVGVEAAGRGNALDIRRQGFLEHKARRPEPMDNLEKVLLWVDWNLDIIFWTGIAFIVGFIVGKGKAGD